MVDEIWCVLAIQARKESYVEVQIRSSGYTVVCPRYRKIVRHARSRRTVNAPLFPGYLFVNLEHSLEDWRPLNSIPGSIGLIKFNHRPATLDPIFVRSFLSRVNSAGIAELDSEINVGDVVQALGGPFDRAKGEVVQLSDDNRVKILLEALNRKVEVTLPKGQVAAAA